LGRITGRAGLDCVPRPLAGSPQHHPQRSRERHNTQRGKPCRDHPPTEPLMRSSRAAFLPFLLACAAAVAAPPPGAADNSPYDVLISGGTVYDGTGGKPFVGDVAIRGDRIVYVGPKAPRAAREHVDAHGKAVVPGFINMLAHPEESLLVDGRALSD